MRIVSWNVNGIRAIQQRLASCSLTFKQFFDTLQADIICFQETKISTRVTSNLLFKIKSNLCFKIQFLFFFLTSN